MRWQLYRGDILDLQADVLICSANVYLSLSGGVGGAFLYRYGPAMQEWLNAYLTERGVRHVHRGNVIVAPPCGSPYKAVLHAVAVDGLYESSPEIVTQVLADTLCQANALGARTVALTAIATGYGRMPMSEFAVGLREILSNDFPSVERVIIALRSPTDTQELLKLVPELESIVDRSKQFGNAEP